MELYRDTDDKYCQGDLIDDIPSVHLKSLDGALAKCVLKGNREAWEILPYGGTSPASGKIPDFKGGEKIPAFCQVSRAILLTHGCDIDNDLKHRLVALVRPLAPVAPEVQAVIRENRNFSFMHLPADASRNIDESYIDFRRITCITPELLQQGTRLASLSDPGVQAIHERLFRFLTHRDTVLPGR